MHVLALLGSLRKGSYNRMTLNAAIELAPPGVTFEIADLSEIPPYNQDVEDAGVPATVQKLKDQIAKADAVLFATPEYNYSMPGVLKNAIDWASRPPKDNPFNGKPCAIISASTGLFGGARAQYHLRQSCVFVNLLTMNRPEVMVTKAQEKFDENGVLKDEATKKVISAFMKSFQEWTERMKR